MATDRTRINETARDVQKIEREIDAIRRYMVSEGKDAREILETCSQFQDPSIGEMLTRWDMAASAPDILITNTSMLNIMLMRDVENPIFDMTRDWLGSDPSNTFTLVVDELHSYRGTQGTEVALVVRNMLDRLGLAPGSKEYQLKTRRVWRRRPAGFGHDDATRFDNRPECGRIAHSHFA